jgi:hypothetical protein
LTQRRSLDSRKWKTKEYGFLVIEQSRPVVRQLGHEGFWDSAMRYFYTTPYTEERGGSVGAEIPPHMATITRAFCHTHPTPGTFSSGDFTGFKKLRELTAKHKLRYGIVYYLLQSNGQVRRSSNEKDFYQGDLISGLDKAIP